MSKVPLTGISMGVVVVAAALWLGVLLVVPADSGSLDARVNAVGATVRCPICPEPIPLNDVHNTQAIQMRQFIRAELQRGVSEDGVRQELVARYGRSLLLAPPQRGFDLLIWLVPVTATAVAAVSVVLAARRWSEHEQPVMLVAASAPTDGSEVRPVESSRFDEMLDRELAARE